ncbi:MULTISPECIES: hypothetical protein [unclassified Bradyrhizobium]|uniref:hypothetical protein n=1 Tax=unclassified Bradyrhizobium TaxID=2631580 RepID=UPI002479690D|nr:MULTISPECIES: hypothetical protein [unclassified Bradyrhizobium]WGR74344.1 hypothetical protein MTX24_16600 [Bradyrhizobium sp. ISRA426]WGR79179.1 hypothetical protein MTX21_01715 [Bradyrhizobium sp. ISRA430]WGR90600.1 hypothetical protein MTX25_39860 [Bradyrhizobium sp. ISRA432]
MIPKITGAQRDFSSGEIDVALKRSDDHPARKTGLRQMANFRILNSGAIQDRPGKRASLYLPTAGRTERIVMSPDNVFDFAFGWNGNGEIRIYDAVTGLQKAAFGNQGNGAFLPWTLATMGQIVYAVLRNQIFFTFPGMRPQVLTWDGTPSGWTIADFAEQIVGGQRRTFFYRISPQGITIAPSAQTGQVTVTASQPFFTAAHLGTRIRYINRQLLINVVNGPYPSLTCGALVEEALPGHQTITSTVDPTTIFSVGDVVRGSVTGSVGQVFQMQGAPTNSITIQLLNTNSTPVSALGSFRDPGSVGGTLAFTSADTIIGPGGSIPATSPGTIDIPAPTTIWDEEVMNNMQGYPRSVFVDQYRLGFCDFPTIPEAIGWSAINAPTDMYVGSDPSNAIFEVVPDKCRVYYVVPGAESSEFVFCDKKLYYIKIDAQNPLKPGSVGFQTLSSDGCAQVQPRAAQEMLVYVNAGRNSVRAIEALGAYYRPFNVRALTDFAAHLFSNISALAVPTADGTFNERYIYVLNGDNSLVVGKYTVQDGQIAPLIGWGPWPDAGTIFWVAATNADVLFTTKYFNATICEILDDSKYLDGAIFVNSLPATFTAPFGQGPLWWIAGQTVSLMDQSTRSMGTYNIDANGFIVPQGNAGEDLTRADLVAGQPWTSIAEPFCPDASPGQSVHQRMFKRRVSRFAAYVIQSTGFMMARLFAGPVTPTSAALGTVMNERRFPPYNQDDDPTKPPPLRETVERTRPIGRAFDPRVAVIKDTPGPMQIAELGVECSI